MRRRYLSLIGWGLVLGGCASSTHNLAYHSASFLGCPVEQVRVTNVQRRPTWVTWEAEGCGKRSRGSADDMVRNPKWDMQESMDIGRAGR